jgi:hypothetical protein
MPSGDLLQRAIFNGDVCSNFLALPSFFARFTGLAAFFTQLDFASESLGFTASFASLAISAPNQVSTRDADRDSKRKT